MRKASINSFDEVTLDAIVAAWPRGKWLKRDGTLLVRQVDLWVGGRPFALVCKFRKASKLEVALRKMFGFDRFLNAAKQAQFIASKNIATPKVLANFSGRFDYELAGFMLVTEFLEEGSTLRQLSLTGCVKRSHIQQCLDMLVKLHDSHVYHGDAKWANFLFGPSGGPWLIDLDGCRRTRRYQMSMAARDLARFLLDNEELDVGLIAGEEIIGKYIQDAGVPAGRFRQEVNLIYEKLSRRHRKKYGIE